MPRIKHKGAAKNTKLNGSITNSANSLVADDLAGWPDGSGSEPFTFVIGRGTANEEKCLATGRSGNTITGVTRGYDDTTGTAHNDDEPVEHCLSAVVVDEANLHVNDDTRDDHGQYLGASRHDVTARHAFGAGLGTPGAPADVGTVAAQGAGTVPARDSHVHKIGAGAIAQSTMFAAGVVGNAALAAAAVGSANLVDGAVTNIKIGTGEVTSSKIADGTIIPTDIAAANVDGAAGVTSLRKLGAVQSQATLRALPVDGVGPAAAAVDHKHGTPFPAIRKANATSSLNLPNAGGTTPTDVGGAADTLSTVNANAEIQVMASASINIGATPLGALNAVLVELVVDGVTQPGVITLAHASLTDFTVQCARSWKVAFTSAGSHTVKLQAHKAASAGIANILIVDTGFTIVVID